MNNIIACRIASYGKFQDQAWSHQPRSGFATWKCRSRAGADWTPPGKSSPITGSRPSRCRASVRSPSPMWPTTCARRFMPARNSGPAFCFLSVKKADTPESDVWQRMRAIGDLARGRRRHGGHGDPSGLGDQRRGGAATMQAIDHPNVRITTTLATSTTTTRASTASPNWQSSSTTSVRSPQGDPRRFQDQALSGPGQGSSISPGSFDCWRRAASTARSRWRSRGSKASSGTRLPSSRPSRIRRLSAADRRDGRTAPRRGPGPFATRFARQRIVDPPEGGQTIVRLRSCRLISSRRIRLNRPWWLRSENRGFRARAFRTSWTQQQKPFREPDAAAARSGFSSAAPGEGSS